ncbi:MAG: pentapeptide repeat-containing protein [Candidatus Buchananbacteria bacterium]
MELSASTFENQTWQNLACLNQDLRHKEFVGCVFKKCDFSNSQFSDSAFINCTLVDCNLANIKVDGCSFQEVAFENCKLVGVIFNKINTLLLRWAFKNCIITLCNFSLLDIRHSKFTGCEIKETDFIKTNLSGADFAKADLRGSRFQNTNLEKANFVGAKNYFIDPTGNKLKQARFATPEVLALLVPFGIKIEY